MRGRCPRPLDDGTINKMAEGPGFEPGLTESESVVLPLNDPPASVREFLTIGQFLVKLFSSLEGLNFLQQVRVQWSMKNQEGSPHH